MVSCTKVQVEIYLVPEASVAVRALEGKGSSVEALLELLYLSRELLSSVGDLVIEAVDLPETQLDGVSFLVGDRLKAQLVVKKVFDYLRKD
jgi:hypothetical protein